MDRFAVIVTYEPEMKTLETLCRNILKQGFCVIIIDNSEHDRITQSIKLENCSVIFNGKNMGIANAQNTGIKEAKVRGGRILSFFDQDSRVSETLLLQLSDQLEENSPCIICPVSINIATGKEYPSQTVNRIGWTNNIYAKETSGIVPVDIAISSGMTTLIDVIEKVGWFDEDFFIDFVDIDWCLRSKAKGIPIYILPEAVMEHSIGDRTLSIGWMKIIQHSPVRTYYKVRNSFLLLRKKTHLLFALRQICLAMFQNLILLFFVKNKQEYFKSYIIGIYHGIIGRVGKGDINAL
jgi:rhamnosyltransferase